MMITPNMTKEGVEIKRGQVWRDLDKRTSYRHVRVISIADGKVTAQDCNADGYGVTHRTTKLSVSRMHNHSTGWVLVRDVS